MKKYKQKMKKFEITTVGDVTPQEKKLARHLAKAVARSFPSDRYPNLQVHLSGDKGIHQVFILPHGSDHLDEKIIRDSLSDQSGAIH